MTADSLLSILLRGAALSALTLAGVLALRRASAAHRHLAWTIGAVALLLLPAVAWTLPAFDVAVLPAPAAAPAVVASPRPEAPVAAASSVAPAADAALAFVPDEPLPDAAVARAPATASSRSATPSPFVLVWAAGALVVAIRLSTGARAVRRIVARSEPVRDERVLGIARDMARSFGAGVPRLRVTGDVEAPLTVGAFRPHVLLPAAALSWSEGELRLALLHEFAHVTRRDLLAEFAARLALAVHWPNPLASVAVRRLRVERERACDDLVLESGHGAREYAGFLVALARALRAVPARATVAATMAGGPQFEGRVRAILDGAPSRRRPSARTAAAFASLAVALTAFAACVHPTPATPDEVAAPALDHEDAQGAAPTAVLTVAADGSGQYTSIAAAVDAAPAGALVRVGPGTFEERLVVTKSVTIEGAGAGESTVFSTVTPEERQRVWDACQKEVAAANSDDERTALQARLMMRQSEMLRPTLRVRGARDVVVRGLTLSSRGVRPEGGIAPGAVVDVADGALRMEKAAVVGGDGPGVLVGQRARLAMDGCLVAGVWGDGVVVDAQREDPSEVRLSGCDIRNCRHYGIAIGGGNRAVTIGQCRISGSSWHGIRYDDASPTVRGNLIFGNDRYGIYASGATQARVEGNLFFENGMGDVGCWYASNDVIEGNTFVNAKRESVAILGDAAPVVRRNVFSGCKTALLRTNVGERSGERSVAIFVRPATEGAAGGDWRFAIENLEWTSDGAAVAPATGSLLDTLKVKGAMKLEETPVPGTSPPRYLSAVVASVRTPPGAPPAMVERVRALLADAGFHRVEVVSEIPNAGTIEGNWFWKNGADAQAQRLDGRGVAAAPLPAGNVAADPGFTDPEHRNYALAPTSAARAAGAGAAAPLAFETPWPARPEEAATAPKPIPAPPTQPSPTATKPADPAAALARAKADVLQISDAARRERGLADLGAALASDDPAIARPALASLYEFRDVKYDRKRFRADVVRQLGSTDDGVQFAAAYAFMQVEREEGDIDLVLAAAEKKPVTPGGLLHVAMMLSKGRVEGRLADLFVKALAVDDPRRGAMDTANYLRGMWAAPAVEDAVVAAWRRYAAAGHERLLWPYIFGQMRPAPRESRVRAIFEMMAGGDDSVRQLAGVAVTGPVDETARPLAAQLAAAALADAPTSSLRRTYLDAIKANGGREQVPTLRALAGNEMVGEDLRTLAGQIADDLERR
jgi:parallel beta-helix repeat protein